MSLAELTSELTRVNPEIRAARFRYEAATKRPSQASTPPEPKVTFADFGVGHPFSRLSVSDFAYLGLGVSQEIPFPGKLALAGDEARKEAEGESQMYRAVLLEKTAELKEAYFEWFSITKDMEITGKSRDLIERFEKISRARYSVGKGLQQDVLKAQVERSAIEQQMEVLTQRQATIEARIAAMLNRAPGQPLGHPAEVQRSEFSLDPNALADLVKQNAPRLRARQSEVDARGVGIERAKKEFRPDLSLSFQWQKTASMFPDYYMAVAEVKLPVFFRRKQRFGVEEAAARLAESRENYQATQQELVWEAKDQYFKIRSSERLLDLYRSGIIPQASLALESAVAGYEVGTLDFLTLLNSQATVLTYEMQYYEELAKHEQALARLEPLVAKELTK
ncbi:MAG: TolC family protein [Acidobacteriia bacterium]|nr:TolC family protein [Terriglobia bacterium]